MSASIVQDLQEVGGEFAAVLDRETRDAIDGSLLLPGERVLRNPLSPGAVRAASDRHWKEFIENGYAWDADARRRTWQPELTQLPANADRSTALANDFSKAVDANLLAARNDLLPLVNIPPAVLMLPVTLWINAATPPSPDPSASLTDRLIDALVRASGLPSCCPLTEPYRAMLRRCHAVHAYEIRGTLGVRQLVVSVFASPFRFTALRGIAFVPLDSTALAAIQEVVVAELERAVASSCCTYVTVGAASLTDDAGGAESGRQFRLVCTPDPRTSAGAGELEWIAKHPPLLARRCEFVDFVDALKPETRPARAARVARCVVQMVLSGFKGNITIGTLEQKTGYSRSSTYDAIFDLEDAGNFLAYKRRDDGVLCIARKSDDTASGQQPARRRADGRMRYYLRMALIAVLTIAGGVLQAHVRSWRHWPIVGGTAAFVVGWSIALFNRYWTPLRMK